MLILEEKKNTSVDTSKCSVQSILVGNGISIPENVEGREGEQGAGVVDEGERLKPLRRPHGGRGVGRALLELGRTIHGLGKTLGSEESEI